MDRDSTRKGSWDTPEDPDPQLAAVPSVQVHAPAPRVQVDNDPRSVVLADEVDDDRTPPRGVSAPLSGVDHPVPRPPRSLPTYDRRNDPTIVLPRRAVFRRSRRIMLAPRQLVAVVVACVVTVCAGAFMLGAAISSAWQERATTAEPEPAHGVTLPEVTVPAPEAESGDKPLTLSDLPVERAATK